MKQLFAFLLFFVFARAQSQYTVVVIPTEGVDKPLFPEHGFLPGKQFRYYPTIGKYDFTGQHFRLEFFDRRDSLHIIALPCSDVELNNQSEFAGAGGAGKVSEYFQRLFPQAGITLDSAAADTLRVFLQAMDSRLIGFGSITAHGLCSMKIEWKDFSKTYCIDITDKDPHSPVGKNAFVTRKTATRIIQSASIREVIELFFIDLKAIRAGTL